MVGPEALGLSVAKEAHLIGLLLFFGPSASECFPLCGDLSEVFGPALRSLFSTLRAKRGSGRFFQQIVSETQRSGEKFVGALGALFYKVGGAENFVRPGYQFAERFQIVLFPCHERTVAPLNS